MNLRLLHAALWLVLLPSLRPALAHQDAPQVLGAASQGAPRASLSALARFFDVPLDATSEQPGAIAGQNKPGDDWARLVAASRTARLPFVARRAKARDIASAGLVLARLNAPAQIVLVQAIARDNVLLFVDGRDVLMARRDFERRFSGDVLGSASPGELRIEEPIREIKLRSLGGSGEVVQSIRLRNLSTRALPIRVASTSCGCTGASVSPSVLAPGQSGILTAKMHATDSRLVTVNLQVGDAKTRSSSPWSVVALQTRAPQVELPLSLVLNAAKGEAASTSGVVRLPPGARLLKITSSQPWLRATAQPTPQNSLAKSSTISIEARLLPSAPEGRFEGAIRLRLANAPLDELVVPVAGMVSNDVLAEPSALVLGAQAAGSTIRKTIIVRGPRPFSIRSAEGGKRVSIKADPQVLARTHAVEISTRAEGEEGSSRHERATLSLSDGRALDVDIFLSITSASTSAASSTWKQARELKVGDLAPDFELRDHRGVARKLSGLKNKKALLLTFFPRCFSGGCASQLASLQRERSSFEKRGIEIWAISTDAVEGERGLRAFGREMKLGFPLLSDPSRRVCQAFGAARTADDLALRQSVLIDKGGVVRLLLREVRVHSHGRDVLESLAQAGL